MARMTVTDDWEPEFPPVSISIGMKAVRMTSCESAFSKLVIIRPVNVAEIISSISQGTLCLNSSHGEVLR